MESFIVTKPQEFRVLVICVLTISTKEMKSTNVTLKTTSRVVEAKTRVLKTTWNRKMVFDIETYSGINDVMEKEMLLIILLIECFDDLTKDNNVVLLDKLISSEKDSKTVIEMCDGKVAPNVMKQFEKRRIELRGLVLTEELGI